MTSNTQQVQRPNAPGPQRDEKKLRFGLTNAAAVTLVAGALVFAGLARSCKPGPEKIIKVKDKCEVCAPVESPPKKGDGKCEAEKGENNPYSEKYDASCGYCGDGKQQEWENKDNCPVDFLCEKGTERYWRKTFAAFKPMEGGKLELTTVSVTKKCNKDDKPVTRHGMRTGMKPLADTGMKPEPVVVKPGGPCQGGDPSTLRAITNAAYSALDSASSSLKDAHKPEGARILATLTLYVSPSGQITGKSVSSRCVGTCATPSLNAASYVSLGGVPSSIGGNPGANCTIIYRRVYK
ncbi:MAG: hypothetical protein AB1295_00560 [Candidatus Micrarchaeota archaeon]